jgi:8-hydroxy-5-deazaflavin:NADPH oxidoreductase
MKIGVIGTGNIGGTLARKLSAAGHDVRVANSRGLEGVRAFANEIGATAVDTRGAVKGVDLIVQGHLIINFVTRTECNGKKLLMF